MKSFFCLLILPLFFLNAKCQYNLDNIQKADFGYRAVLIASKSNGTYGKQISPLNW